MRRPPGGRAMIGEDAQTGGPGTANGSATSPEPMPFEPVSIEDFGAVDVNQVTAAVSGLARWDVDLPMIRAAEAAQSGGDSIRFRVLRLMAMVLGMHLRDESEGDDLAPQWLGPDGRTAIPDDFREAQAKVLAAVAPGLDHPTVRARVADVAYEAGERRAGRTAIGAYCEISSRLLAERDGMSEDEAQLHVTEVIEPLSRAFRINARVARKGTVVEALAEAARAACAFALRVRAYVAFSEIGRLLLSHRLVDPAVLAGQAEHLATSAGRECRMPVKQVWLLAAEAHERAGAADASRAATIEAIETTFSMKDDVPASAAKAHWVKMAIREYRGLGGCQERVDELRELLRQLQDASVDEFAIVRTRAEGIAGLREATVEMFAACPLSEGLKGILPFIQPGDPEEQKAEALRLARMAPLSNLFASSHADDQGRVVAQGEALFGGEPSEAWFKEHCIRNARLARHYTVGGRIEPARQTLNERFSIQERHMAAIVAHSDFVPPGHHQIYGLGLARLWQGDYVTAASLLIPQLENSLRHVLQLVGRDSSKIEEDGIQGDRTLAVLLSYFRADLEQVFGPEMVWELDALLNFRPGPALRHELAHGKLPSHAFHSVEVVSACWLIFYLVVLPTLEIWDSDVAKLLATASGAPLPGDD